MANYLPEADQRGNLPDYNWIAALPNGEREWIFQVGGTFRSAFLPTGLLDWKTLEAIPTDPIPPGRRRTFFVGSVLYSDDGSGAVAVGGGVTDHGALTGLPDDDHLQYLRLAGRVAGQLAVGGTGATAGTAANEFRVRGSSDTNLGRFRVQSPMEIDNVIAGDSTALRYRPVFTASAAYIGGFAIASPDITIGPGAAVFIPTAYGDSGIYRVNTALSSATYTYANIGVRILNVGNFNLLTALILNIGLTHERTTSGTSTASITGVAFAPQTRASVVGAICTKIAQIALRCVPTYSTVVGSTANLGAITGLLLGNPTGAFLQPVAGLETLDSAIAVDMENVVFGGNVTKAAVRSAQTAASNAFFLLQTGNAQSRFLGEVQILANDVNLALGLNSDVGLNWNGSGLEFSPLLGDDLRITFGANTHTITSPQFLVGPSDLLLAFDTVRVGSRASFLGVTNRLARSQSINANVNDFQGQSTGLFQRGTIRLTATGAARTVTGFDISISATGDELIVINVGAFDVVLAHQDVASLAANRLITPTGASLTLGPDEMAKLWYDLQDSRWRILETTGA